MMHITEKYPTPLWEITPLVPEASSRFFFRIKKQTSDHSEVLMQLCGQDKESLAQEEYNWIFVQKFFKDNAIPVPEIIKIEKEDGFILMQDLGDLSLFHEIQKNLQEKKDIDLSYEKAVDLICLFIKQKREHLPLQRMGCFSFAKLSYELDFFYRNSKDFFSTQKWEPLLKQEKDILQFFSELCHDVAPLSKFLTHRDFHSRNIMCSNGSLFIIDFQDIMLGAASYDLISLCFDPYVPLSLNKRLDIFLSGIEKIKNLLHLEEQFQLSEKFWKRVFLQRQLKIIGSYVFLGKNKNKNYLSYIKPTIEMIREIIPEKERQPLTPLLHLLEQEFYSL